MKKNYESPVVDVLTINEVEIETAEVNNVIHWWGQDPNDPSSLL